MVTPEYAGALTELDASRKRLIALADALCKDQKDGPLHLETLDVCETIGRVLVSLVLIEYELRNPPKYAPESRDVEARRTAETDRHSDPEKGESEAQS